MKEKVFCEFCIYLMLAYIALKSFKQGQDVKEWLVDLQINSFDFGFLCGSQQIKTITENDIVHIDNGEGKKVCDTKLVKLFKKALGWDK